MSKPFHELSDDEYSALEASGANWLDVEKAHPQPEWCDYPGALLGMSGCWALVYRKVKSQADCGNCECIKS
ncbi:hypothetical protein [Azospirillum sp. sgz302134]